MDIKEIVYTELRNRGCKLREEAGILYITTPDGAEWDMTIPMPTKKHWSLADDAETRKR